MSSPRKHMRDSAFLSHPDTPLREHLREVGEEAKRFIKSLPLSNQGSLSKAAYFIGLCHDFGKYSSFFQAHLREGKDFGAKHHHAFISALMGAWMLEKIFPWKSGDAPEEFLPLIGYLAIHRHHGDLKAPELVIPNPKVLKDSPQFLKAEGAMRDHLKALWVQREDLLLEPRFSKVKAELQGLGIRELDDFFAEETFLNLFKNLFYMNRLISERVVSERTRISLALWAMLLFSVLIDADKRRAGGLEEVKRKHIPPDLVDNYIAKTFREPRTPLDPLRTQIYQEVMENLPNISWSQGQILTLTAPTGSGKTLTAFSLALKLRDKCYRERGYLPRIIYVLPFINIIEQNYAVFQGVLKELPDFEMNDGIYLLKHHHLAEINYKEGDESRPVEETLLLTEAWESEITVTTFVQFLHSVIGFKNSFLRKFHNIVGSIVILDEIQNIPIEQWNLVRNFFKALSEYFGVTVLQMTATRPLIFEREEEQEVVPFPEKRFLGLNRTVIHAKTSGRLSLVEFTDELLEFWDGNSSLLVVLNTIPMSIKIYEELKAKLSNRVFPIIGYPTQDISESNAKVPLVYLSTNIIPLQRAERVRFLKSQLDKGLPAIVVSTQVIEAGVDLDFHDVIRDIGPLDSIVQVAGRCNRSFQRKIPGVVRIYFLKEGGAEKVYKKLHIWGTLETLRDGKYPERVYIQQVEQFFKKVYERVDTEESRTLWEAFMGLKFHRENVPSVSDYRLIEEGPQVPIFVVLTQDDEVILQKFTKEVLQERDLSRRRRACLVLRRAFHERLITPRLERVAKNLPPEVEGSKELRFIPKDLDTRDKFYNLETGFIWQPGERAWIW